MFSTSFLLAICNLFFISTACSLILNLNCLIFNIKGTFVSWLVYKQMVALRILAVKRAITVAIEVKRLNTLHFCFCILIYNFCLIKTSPFFKQTYTNVLHRVLTYLENSKTKCREIFIYLPRIY